jgi:hypothetical protein
MHETLQIQEKPKDEVIRLLQWIANNPTEWERISQRREREEVPPLKTLEDCDLLTFSGLYSAMIVLMFSEQSIITSRVFRKIVARTLLQQIEELGELEALKDVLELLHEEWTRIENENRL